MLLRVRSRLAARGEPRIIPESLLRRAGAWSGVRGFPVRRSSAIKPRVGVRLGVPVIPDERGTELFLHPLKMREALA